MAKVEVLRVENALGQGPYRENSWRFAEQLSDAHMDGFHPGPTRAGEPWGGLDACFWTGYSARPDGRSLELEVCGFLTIDQFLTWFEERWRRCLAEHGFGLALYLVEEEEVFVGKSQITFRKGGGQLIDTLPLV